MSFDSSELWLQIPRACRHWQGSGGELLLWGFLTYCALIMLMTHIIKVLRGEVFWFGVWFVFFFKCLYSALKNQENVWSRKSSLYLGSHVPIPDIAEVGLLWFSLDFLRSPEYKVLREIWFCWCVFFNQFYLSILSCKAFIFWFITEPEGFHWSEQDCCS